MGKYIKCQALHTLIFRYFIIPSLFLSSFQVHNPKSALSINDVIPPDEYHDHVNNSVYTNVIAQISLNFATEAAVYIYIYIYNLLIHNSHLKVETFIR